MRNDAGFRFRSLRREIVNHLASGLTFVATIIVLAPLLAIFVYLVYRGASALNLSFFTALPKPVGEVGGGMANAIAGSGIILGIACIIGIPIGIGSGIYLSEYGRGHFGDFIRFTADVLNGVPSIVIGIVAYGLVVLKQGHFSALSGGVALGMMMVPTVTRSTEEMLLMVPRSVREAALGLGIPQWRSTLSITLRTALPGVITGVMLAFARVAGETAPLLFTAFGNTFWNLSPVDPMAALPLQVYQYAISPYDSWHAQAWAGALVLVALVLALSAAVRVVARHLSSGS